MLVADDAADGRLQFLRNALRDRDGGETARLGACDASAVLAATKFHRHLRELRCLARARVAADDYDVVLLEESENLLPMFANREFSRIVKVVVV